jgi:hypothetical protein
LNDGYRGLTNLMRGGHPGPEGSTAKLLWSQADRAAQTATEIPGIAAAHGTDWAPDDGQWEFYELLARSAYPRRHDGDPEEHLGERVLAPKD